MRLGMRRRWRHQTRRAFTGGALHLELQFSAPADIGWASLSGCNQPYPDLMQSRPVYAGSRSNFRLFGLLKGVFRPHFEIPYGALQLPVIDRRSIDFGFRLEGAFRFATKQTFNAYFSGY